MPALDHRAPQLELWFERVVMERAPGPGPALVRLALAPFSVLYSGVIELYKWLYRAGVLKSVGAPCRVISIGNLTMGGVGKTVAVQSLARTLQGEGIRCVVVSYGFRAAMRGDYAVVSDGVSVRLTAEEAGDEAVMVATSLPGVPVVIGRRRALAALAAAHLFQPQVIILDDGFQHWRLRRDVDLVLLDARRPLGNGRVFPAGSLRERPASLQRSTALVLTRSDLADEGTLESSRRVLRRLAPGKTILETCHRLGKPYQVVPGSRRNEPGKSVSPGSEPVMLISGIAQNESFLASVRGIGINVRHVRSFPDHHHYSPGDVAAILDAAGECAAVVTTEKDAVKLASLWPDSLPLVAMPVSLSGIDTQQWLSLCGLNHAGAGIEPGEVECI